MMSSGFSMGAAQAQQVNAGAKIGGNYIYVGCTAASSRHDNIGYCYRCDTLATADRQEFVTKEEAWKKGGTLPLNDLKVSDLKVELHAHEVDTSYKSKEELEKASVLA